MGRFRYCEVEIPSDGLSSEEVGRLWGRYRRGRGVRERNLLWEHYYGMAYQLAVQAKRGMGQDRGVTVGDLCQWASLGLLRAIERFDFGRGVKFESYAFRGMRGGMGDGLRDWDVLGRSGRRAARREPGGPADVLGAVRRFGDIVGEDGAGSEPRNQVGVIGAESEFDGSDEWDWLMRGQSRRDRLILALYFREGMTQAEVASVVGLSQSGVAVRVREAKGLIRERVEGRMASNGGQTQGDPL